MKPIKNQASSIAGLSTLSAEAKLCFGAAGGCAVIGSAGYAINALTSMETTLSAFLVISAFYLMVGVMSSFESTPDVVPMEPAENRNDSGLLIDGRDTLIESAA